MSSEVMANDGNDNPDFLFFSIGIGTLIGLASLIYAYREQVGKEGQEAFINISN